MSFDDFLEFQKQIDEAEKEQEHLEKLKGEEQINDFGFSEVLKQRQKRKDALKERLVNQNFTDKEIEKLFKIISKAEEDMEIVKSKFDYKAGVVGSGEKLYKDLIAIQTKMKEDFDKEFFKMLEAKKKK